MAGAFSAGFAATTPVLLTLLSLVHAVWALTPAPPPPLGAAGGYNGLVEQVCRDLLTCRTLSSFAV